VNARSVAEIFGTGGHYATQRTFLASLECELEGLRTHPSMVGNFAGKKDGSLRNCGYEYVTVEARSRQVLMEDFTNLHKNLAFIEKEDPFSHRTSTHVHVNVSPLSVDHVKNMLLLYALFEEFFFSMVKPFRRDNIHCVPLTDTYLPKDYGKPLDSLVGKWSKYTAFNIKPIQQFGSIEFRHLHGTGDAEEVNTWLHVLENLWKLCQKVEINQTTIADAAVRAEWFDLLFFPSPSVMSLRGSMANIIRNSLIDVKFSTI
jgi:hypothetical protein